ncbi:NAD(P)H-binding protein [Amnibacterium endophyticum]|uniref:NAD(P)H-binding protein n=1 Tax=Amnibacterium endophyticum TaxID=2109337 RepID=A0ABW4LKH0_9MICO
MTLALTGSTGRLGGRVAHLLGPAVDVLIVRDPARAPRIDGDPEIRTGTYGGADAGLFAGVDVLLLVSGAESATRLEEHRTAVRAAAEAGVRHVVYTSFDGAAPDADFTLGRDHWHTEQAVRDSGTAFTFLRDSFYADVLPLFADEAGVIRGPAGAGAVALVARDDVADAAVEVLRDPAAHAGATYVLTGPEALTLAAATARMTAALGRPYSYREETVEEAYASRRALSDERWQLDAWVSTYTAIASGRMAAVSDDVPRLTGRRARTLEQALVGA